MTAGGRRFPEAVVFDLDGTLVDSAGDLADALNVMMGELDLAAHSLEAVKGMIGGGARKLVERALAAHERPASEAEIDAITTRFVAIYRGCATRQTRLYAGAETLLAELAAAGVRLGLCTNKPTEIAEDILVALGIRARFGSVVGSTSGFPRKPDPAPLLGALAPLDVAPAAAVLIGDSGADVGAARAAAVPVVLVTFGYSRTPVAELGADALVSELSAVPSVLDRIWAARPVQ
ncbi:MAG: phosphoglycolate phosphatase [Hyphomicrobiaceae bacterium]|nr:phosphoglycolate phosphatase [Hyphomicrobiaceae bacterium]